MNERTHGGVMLLTRVARTVEGARRISAARLLLWASVVIALSSPGLLRASCASPANAIEAENCNTTGVVPQSTWDVSTGDAGDPTIQGFATDISVNVGQTISFKINTTATAYHLDIYRMGYYQGNGARLITTIPTPPTTLVGHAQPACLTDPSTDLVDCGNWSVSTSWTVPAGAVSGIYFAKVIRNDTGGASHIVFVVRNDSSTSAVLFQTSDETWQAYNEWGGNSLYGPTGAFDINNRARKVSYNRPFHTRSFETASFVFYAEYPMVRFLEANGYDVSYFTSIDAARSGSLITNHKLYLSVGHDEYWSGPKRASIQAARDGGVNLAFFSGNEGFWKTRWENSIDGTSTPYRTLVCYKETLDDAQTDPLDISNGIWTGTWRDPTFSPPADGGKPENAITGTIFAVNGCGSDNLDLSIQIPWDDGKMRFWRNTSINTQPTGQTTTLLGGSLGYEWDIDADNGFRPAGLFHLSTATYNLSSDYLIDYGSLYDSGTATHHMTMYKASSGALVFGAGTVQWPWGLDSNHDTYCASSGYPTDPNMQQATVNLFADMGVQPASIESGLSTASRSTDTTPPVSTITSPAPGATIQPDSTVTIQGTAADSGGGVVGGVEVSLDGGNTWHPATGRETWTYSWFAHGSGPTTLRSRAVDDSGNLETPSAGVPVTVSLPTCPCTIWPTSTSPASSESTDQTAYELGVRFEADFDGSITGIRYYKGADSVAPHLGHLWDSSGNLLGTVTFSNESTQGWQEADFTTPVSIIANTVYVASYSTPNGFYFGDGGYFLSAGVDNPPLHALKDGVSGSNGIFGNPGVFPTNTFGSTNYWVDVVYTSSTTATLSSIAVNPTNPTLQIGHTQQFTATGTYSDNSTKDITSEVTWTSSKTSVATISSSGLATTASGGASTIVATLGTVSGSTTLTVAAAPLSITTTSLPVGQQNVSYAVTLAATGGVQPYTWSLASGSLPAGLSLSSTGQISGTPTASTGTATFTVQVKDSGTRESSVNQQQTATQSLSISILSLITIWPSTSVPTLVDANDANSVELGVKFQSDVAGPIYGIRFYKSAGNTGTHVANLWDSSGDLLATATFTSETASGWQEADFASPVEIAANTVYVASYHTTVGHYSADVNYFATAGVDNPPLHALANGVSGSNGVYAYSGSSVFPTSAGNGTNYWVDVAMLNSAATLSSIAVTPANPNPAVGDKTVFTATGTYSDSSTRNLTDVVSWASSNTAAATINTLGTATAVATGSSTISATLGAISGSTTLTVQAAPLVISTSSLSDGIQNELYSATLAATGGLTPYTWSLASGTLPVGLSLAANGQITGTPFVVGTSNFTVQVQDTSSQTVTKSLSLTIDTPPAFFTIWSPSAVPGLADAGPDHPLELGVKFKADSGGSIVAIRFYKSANNTGTHIGNVWDTAGNLLGSVTFSNETASGWQQANFSTPVAIAANTEYVASYHTTVGDYSLNEGYFNTAGVDNPPLHALQTSVSDSNGVYAYDGSNCGGAQPPCFPNTPTGGNNYWVDVAFVPLSVSVSLNPTSVVGGNGSTGTVTLSSAAGAGGVTVSLASDNTAVATVPASVTVASGATAATFPVSTSNVPNSTTAEITAIYQSSSQATLTVNPPSVASVSMNPVAVLGGNTAQGTVTLTGPAPTGGLQVALSSSDPSATVPSTVTVPGSSTTANFTVTTSTVTNSTSSTISASYNGGTPQSAILLIDAGMVLPQTAWSVVYVDSQQTVGDNGAGVNAIDGNPATKWVTQWSPTNAPLPHEIRINLGASYILTGFQYLARQDGCANGWVKDYDFSVSADGTNWTVVVPSGSFNYGNLSTSCPGAGIPPAMQAAFNPTTGQYIRFRAFSEINGHPWTAVAELNVLGTPASSQISVAQVTVNPTDVVGGSTAQGTVTLSGAAPVGGLQVTVSSSDPSVTAPTTVTVPGLATSASFTLNTAIVASTTWSSISASYNGGAPQSAMLQVSAGAAIPQSSWSVVYVDSQETAAENGAGANAIDGNPATKWVTQWSPSSAPLPHEIRVNLGASYTLTGFQYLARQDGCSNGWVKQYEFYVSTDGINWPATPNASGTFSYGNLSAGCPGAGVPPAMQIAFAAATGQYIRFRALSEINGNPWTSVAELGVIGTPASTQDISVAQVTVSPTAVIGGSTAQGTVTLTGPTPVGGLQVALSSSDPSATVPTTVTVPSLATSASFTINTTAVSNPISSTISASYNDGPTQTATLLVNPNTIISQTGWSVVFVDSQETVQENGAGVNAIDGNSATKWVTQWSPSSAPLPHEIRIDLGAAYTLTGFQYLARQDGCSNGWVKNYDFSVSADGANWTVVVPSGTFNYGNLSTGCPGAGTPAAMQVAFAPTTGQYVRFRALSEINGNPWTAVAELGMLGTLASSQNVSVAQVSVNPTSVVGGNTAQGTVTLSGPAPLGGLLITLASGDPSVTVPATVTVAAGNTSATFTINTTTVATATPVNISASYYNTGTQSATLTVNPVQNVLFIIANDSTRAYGTANPAFDVQYVGFLNGDNAGNLGGALSCASSATSTSAAGTYPIHCSGQTSSFYTLQYVDGTLTITDPLSSIAVTPNSNPQIQIGGTQQFVATGTFADSVQRQLAGGGGLAYPLHDMPFGAAGAAAAEAGGKLYLISGSADGITASNQVAAYDPISNTWSTVANLATGRLWAGAASIAGKIYVVGGCTDGSCVSNVATVEVYDPSSNTWTTASNTGFTPRNTLAVGVVAGKLYVGGGYDSSGNAVQNLEGYNPATDSWSSLAAMPGMLEPVGGVIAGKFYVEGTNVGATASVLAAYDPAGDSWSTLTGMPAVAAGTGAAALNGKLYVVTGQNVSAYDPTSDTWSSKNSLGTARSYPQPVTIGNLFYVAGDGASGAIPTLEGFAPDEVSWSSSDTNEASVNQSGLGTGVALGTVQITATSLSTPSISGPATLTIVAGSGSTTMTVVPTANPSIYGQSVSFTATVSSTGATPTGTVSFFDGGTCSIPGTPLGTSLSLNGGGQAGTATSALTAIASPHSILACYSGDGSYAANSYTLSQAVNPATVTPIITAFNKVYDGTIGATIATRSLSGVIGGDDVTLTGGTATFADPNVGTGKVVTATGLSLGGTTAGNYQLSSTTAATTADISSGSLIVIANDNTRAYGQPDPAFDVQYVGFVNGDNSSSLSGPPTCSSASTSTSEAGTYAIHCSGQTAANYTLRYADGTLTVTNPLSSVAVTPNTNPQILIGGTQQFTATGTFADSTQRQLVGNGGLAYPLADMPFSVTGAAAAEAGGKLYVISGSADGITASNQVAAYDPVANSWSTVASLATGRLWAGAGSIAGKIYVVGGCTDGACSSNVSTVEVYDPSSNAWTTVSNTGFTPRDTMAVGVVGGKLYVAGGYDNSGNPAQALEGYDPSTDSWTSLATMPAMLEPIGGTIAGKFYVEGTNIGATASVLAAYDPTGNSWTTLTGMPAVSAGAGAAALNGKLYVVTGQNVSAYDPTSDTWSSKNSLGTARSYPQPVTIGNLFYVAGDGASGAIPTLEGFAPDEVSWSSSDITEATVDQSGLATGVGAGTVQIIGTSLNASATSGQASLTVSQP